MSFRHPSVALRIRFRLVASQSFLIEITASIFGRRDDLNADGYVVDNILDKTGEYWNKCEMTTR